MTRADVQRRVLSELDVWVFPRNYSHLDDGVREASKVVTAKDVDALTRCVVSVLTLCRDEVEEREPTSLGQRLRRWLRRFRR